MKKIHLYFENPSSYRNGLGDWAIKLIAERTGDPAGVFTGEIKNLFSKSFEASKNITWVPADRTEFYFYPLSNEFPLTNHSRFNEYSGASLFRIPSEVIEDCKQNKAGILFYDTWEGFQWMTYARMIADICEFNHGLTPKHFIVLSNNLNQPEDIPFKHVDVMWFQTFNQHNRDHYQIMVDQIKSRKERRHKFLLLNRRPDTGRLALVYKLWDYKEGNLISFGLRDDFLNKQVFDRASKVINNCQIEKLQYIFDQLPLRINDGVDATLNPAFDFSIDKFWESYLHIVTETYFCCFDGHDMMFFSEKTFKPIQMLQPFVLLNYPNSLPYLKKHGYETFSQWIDESYDTELDLGNRIDQITNTIVNYISRTPKELSEIHFEMLPILAHNYHTRKRNVGEINRTLGERLLDTFHSK